MACCDHPALYCPIDYAESGVSAVCGYARRHVSTRQIRDFVDLLDSAALTFTKGVGETVHFYPAFGGAAGRQISDLIIQENGRLQAIDATWWFDCHEMDGELIVGKRTTFNARNLDSPYWKGAIRHHRGIAIVTGIGETLQRDGKKFQYLMEAENPILLGCVYRKFPNNLYSCAVITRDEHERFGKYHDKAFPLMLPDDPEFLKLWLSDAREDEPAIADLLAHPKIFTDLTVTQVKTFKDGKALEAPELLVADN